MGLIDRLQRRALETDRNLSPVPGFRVVADELTQFVADNQALTFMRQGRAPRTAQEQYLVLDMLVEDGRAEATYDGFVMTAVEVARLEADEAAVLGLPGRFAGSIRAAVYRWTGSPEFRIDLAMYVGVHPAPWERRGAIVMVGRDSFLVSPPLLQVLRAIEQHSAITPGQRTEMQNVTLVARLQAAQHVAANSTDRAMRDTSVRFSLGALDSFTTVTPASVGLGVETQPDGSLVVEPALGPVLDLGLPPARWQQLDPDVSHAAAHRDPRAPGDGVVLRLDNVLVILTPAQVAGVQEVRRRPHIRAEHVRAFLRAPGAFYNPDVVDVDVSLSVRLAGNVVRMTYAEAASGGLGPEVPNGEVADISDVPDAPDVADRLRVRASAAAPVRPVPYERLKRNPLPHQAVGITWMAGLMQAALLDDEREPGQVQGALLADGRGLGKTLMALVALAELQEAQRHAGRDPLPTLGVMPPGVLRSWQAEIVATFGTTSGPFTDVVVFDGTTGASEPDRPGALVLTTYEAFCRHPAVFAAVEWGVAVFDEAQALKDPEALATRAAKALDSRFTLVVTSAPVEASLRDFWSLMDTAQPGLLGTWGEFRGAWVTPMEEATGEERKRLGRGLRDVVGSFMLRRTSADDLEGMPRVIVHEHRHAMPGPQVEAYDAVLADHRAPDAERGTASATVHDLAVVSLHPGLLEGHRDREPRRIADSARTLITVRGILDDIRAQDEKVIVFARSRKIQRAMSLWLGEEYGLRVDVVNGAAEGAGQGSAENRTSKVRAFEARAGFDVIILSPLAAVSDLIVGATHAIHLERQWNPAKEAHATDRIFRIGQAREVHVHYPVAIHPSVESFDVILDRLMRTKAALKDAVVVPQEVTQAELERGMGLF